MPRIMIKGGIWRNTEDETLKVFVMKYGKNQWARSASLLRHKSAKQCKARWNEWLDPSIKKTEWSREEEEKLLHMARLMPTQWRTIAPLIGRTPAQCLERYEQLLDLAQQRDQDLGKDDPRKLKPGEIDPNPETRPARPDPVDMNEDELEMLSEARARLANTQGKKAKRKARERQLEEARRLASLQKQRELRAAGIPFREKCQKKRGVDYLNEVPFEKKPAPGFYDTTNETFDPAEPNFKRLRQQELDGELRRDKEAGERKKDKERQKRRKENDLPSAILAQNQFVEPAKKRSRLVLPEPQIVDHELQIIIKVGQSNEAVRAQVEDAGLKCGPTWSLHSDPLSNLQTLRTTASQDNIPMNEFKDFLKRGMAGLPVPKNDFEIVVPKPEEEATEDEAESIFVLDQADLDDRRIARLKVERENELKRRSQVIQRNLPRPREVSNAIQRPAAALDPAMHELQKAEELIMAKMLSMIHYDLNYPLEQAIISGKAAEAGTGSSQAEQMSYFMDQFSEEDLAKASELVKQEMDYVKQKAGLGDMSLETYSQVWEECFHQMLHVPSSKRFTRATLASKKEKIESLEKRFQVNRLHMSKEAKYADKMEKKLEVVLAGHQNINQNLVKQLNDVYDQIDQMYVELKTFDQLSQIEDVAIMTRVESLTQDVMCQTERERDLQKRYAELLQRKEDLLGQLCQ